MCSSSSHSSSSTHYLPILFSEFFHGPHAIFSLFTYLLMRGGQARPYTSPGAVPLVFSSFLLLFTCILWSFFSDVMLMPTDVHRVNLQGWGRFLFFLSGSLIMLRWMYLWKIWCKLCRFCHQKVCKNSSSSQHPMPFHSLALSNYLAHLSVWTCIFLSDVAALSVALLRSKILELSWMKR